MATSGGRSIPRRCKQIEKRGVEIGWQGKISMGGTYCSAHERRGQQIAQFLLFSAEDSRIDLREQRMNDTQPKSGIVKVLQRFRDGNFPKSPSPP